MNKILLLDRERLDEIENNPIFTLWLFGEIDENSLPDEDKMVIYSRQMYYDLLVEDDYLSFLLDRTGSYGIDDFINDESKIKTASIISSIRPDVLRTKAVLYKKRVELEKERKIKEFIK